MKCAIYTFNTVMYTGNAGRRPENRAELSGVTSNHVTRGLGVLDYKLY